MLFCTWKANGPWLLAGPRSHALSAAVSLAASMLGPMTTSRVCGADDHVPVLVAHIRQSIPESRLDFMVKPFKLSRNGTKIGQPIHVPVLRGSAPLPSEDAS